MEIDEPVEEASEAIRRQNVELTPSSTRNDLRESISTPPLVERPGDLPDVTPGSEPWHTHFPTQWLPVIARDIELQRNDKVR